MVRARKEYEVERILKARVSYKRARKIHWQYFVKWKGYSDKSNTWEPVESFESSPHLIEKFWKKVDTGGRDIKKASSFQRLEELAPGDATWSDVEAGGEEDEEEANGGASPKTGRKRSAKTTTNGSPKRKRGRPSKAEKEASAKVAEATESEAQETTDAGEGVDDTANLRSSSRLSEKETYIIPSASDATSKRVVRSFSVSDSDCEDKEGSGEEPARQSVLRKPPMRKRKAYIESDEEDDDADRDDRSSSHDGSLFSGDDEEEQEQEREQEQEQNVPTKATAPTAPVPDEPKTVPLPRASLAPEQPQKQPEETKKPKIALTRQGRPVPRVKIVDDPNIQKAVEMRIHGRIQGQSSNLTIQGSSSKLAASLSASNLVHTDNVRYKPTLLTFEKGKLASHRSKVLPPSQWEPSRPSTFPALESTESDLVTRDTSTTSPASPLDVDGVVNVFENKPAEPQSADAMDTSPDFGPSPDIVGSLETSEAVAPEQMVTDPPPTVDELLRLSGVNGSSNELPDFTPEEAPPVLRPTHTSTDMAESTSFDSHDVARAHTVEEVPAWKRSGIFNMPSPLTILKKVFKPSNDEPLLPTKLSKLVVPLRLSPDVVIPVTLKDEYAASVGPKMSELLKSDQLDGPPGKLFPPGGFELGCIGGAPCPNARLVPSEDCSEEQRLWFSKLAEELANGSVFSVEIGGWHYVLCSSENTTVQSYLMTGGPNIGLRRAVLVHFAPIIDTSLYEECIGHGKELGN